MAKSGQRYSPAEVEEILKRAAEQTQRHGEALSHDELVAIAGEVGIDPEAVEREAAEIATRRDDADIVARHERRRRRGFRAHLTAFLIVNLGLFLLNAALPGPWWFVFPLLAWAVGLAFHAAAAFRRLDDEQRAAVITETRRVRDEQQRRAEKRARRGQQKQVRAATQQAAEQLGQAVEQGVAALLATAARKLEDAAAPRAPTDTAFGRFVAEKKDGANVSAGTPAAAAPPPRSGVRVDPGGAPPAPATDDEPRDTASQSRHARRR